MGTLSNLISFRSLQKNPRHERMCLVVERHVYPRQMESVGDRSRSSRAVETLDGDALASGTFDRKEANLSGTSHQLAVVLRYNGGKWKQCVASTNANTRSMCIIWRFILDRDRRNATTAWLSQKHRTRQFDHRAPQRSTAMTTRINSFTMMEAPTNLSSHCTWNQWVPCHAPQPHDPEASEAISTTGSCCAQGKNETPFQSLTKTLHQAKSDLNSLLRRRGWRDRGESGTLWRKSIILRKKERPDLTTLQAWFSRSTKDSNSFRWPAL